MNSISWPEVLQNRKKSLGIFQFILRLGKCCKSQRAGPGESRKACQNGKCDLPSSVGFEAIKVGRKPGPFYKQWTKNSKGSKQESSKWGTLIHSPGRGFSKEKPGTERGRRLCHWVCSEKTRRSMNTLSGTSEQAAVPSGLHIPYTTPQASRLWWSMGSVILASHCDSV